VTVTVVVCAQFLNAFTGSAMNVSIPTIGADFHAAAADLGWIVTAYNMCTVALLLPFGRLGDLTNRRTMFVTGLAVLTLVAEAAAWAPNLGALIATRVVQGIGASCLFATGQALMIAAVRPERRGRAIGLATASVYIGLTTGPVVGGFLTHHLGWRSVFHVIAVVGVLTVTSAALLLPRGAAPAATASLASRLDLRGAALITPAALLVTYGLTELPDPLALAALAVGAALAAAFLRHERGSAVPLVNPRLFRAGPNFLLSNLSALLSYAATFAVSYLLAIYLQQVRGFGADRSGLVLITSPLVQAAVSPWVGRLADRHSPFALSSAGMGLCAGGLVVFALLTPTTPLPLVIGTLALIGLGFGFFATPNTTAVMSMAEPADYGVTNALLAFMRNLGMVCSMAIITIIVRARFGRTAIADAPIPLLTSTTRLAFAIFVGLCVAGVFTSLNRRQGKGAGGPE
jgi:EmrB/QacA subfamily drug resistance transporter